MRSAEEKVRAEEERRSRHPEKFERKNAERLERAKKRCEQIRQIIGSFDPANLGAANSTTASANATGCSSSSAPTTEASPPNADQVVAALTPSAETIRLLSNAIAGCLQPCNLINKILNEIIGMVPVVPEVAAQASSDQQQQTEFPRQNTATSTSDMNTPTAVHPSNQEIEALFKEAAKELEKMNEIVNNNKTMETSGASTSASIGSSISAITQVEQLMRNLTDSTISNISNTTIVNMKPVDYDDQTDNARGLSPEIEHDYKIVTPPKSMRSRESSIEVHDENSMISDDSRDWTMLDAHTNENEEDVDASFASTHAGNLSVQSSLQVEPSIVSINSVVDSEVDASIEVKELKKSVPVQVQTPNSFFSAATQEEVRASIQKSIETVGELSDIVKNSVALAQESLKNVQQPQPILKLRRDEPAAEASTSVPVQAQTTVPTPRPIPNPTAPTSTFVPTQGQPILYPNTPKVFVPTIPTRAPPAVPARVSPTVCPSPLYLQNLSASTQANLMANRNSAGAKPKTPLMGPAVVVYDPNPKINSSVHQMLNMGFTNEGEWFMRNLIVNNELINNFWFPLFLSGGWLTQLLLNVDGDVPKAINFLTPQPKKQ